MSNDPKQVLAMKKAREQKQLQTKANFKQK